MSDYRMAQISVLGSMLIDERVVGQVVTKLRAEDFTNELSQQVFTAIRDLYIDGEKVDPVLVMNKLGGDTPERRRYLLAAMEQTPTAANVAEYVEIVKQEARLRKLRELGEKMAAAMDLDTVRDLSELVTNLLADRESAKVMSMEEGITRFYERLNKPVEYLKWGMDFLDEGLFCEPGDLVILGGRPSDGKTALALSMAYAQGKDKRVGFFSLETDRDKLFARLFCSVAGANMKNIKLHKPTEDDAYLLAQAVEAVRVRGVYLIQAAGMTVEDIRAHAMARRFDIVYVDYLQLVIPPRAQSRTEEVTKISMGLHTMAQTTGITVVALSQLSRADRKNKDPEPRMSDLRESGQIEQDADVIMFLYREEPEALKSRRILSIKKNKEGELGKWPLLFRGDKQSFRLDGNGFYGAERKRKAAAPQEQIMFELSGHVKTPFDEEEG